ncbi:MAG TPA: hypothetical protein VIM61_10090 [Chthoniobacterales bacterium]|jgi:hypothetical protein
MPVLPIFDRVTARAGVRLMVGALAASLLAACAAKKSPTEKPTPAESGKPKPSPSPSPQPSATPRPSPTPEVRYTATVRVEGGSSTTEDVTPNASPSPSPSATPEASPLPSPTPAATPKPKESGNIFTNTWQKIFPPKPKPAPAAGPAAATSVSTPAPIPGQPREGFFARMWHRVFPRKQKPPIAAPPQWVGTIKLVNERDGYVLIDAINAPTLAPGETLNAVGNDHESGVLRTTADKNPPFFIADLVSGKPRVGDRVYSPKP